MMTEDVIYYLDTNALLKNYVTEKGLSWVRFLLAGNQEVAISELTLIECTVALRRRYQENLLSREQFTSLYQNIQLKSTEFTVVPLGDNETQASVVNSLISNLPDQYRIRSLDAIQLAAGYKVWMWAVTESPFVEFIFVSSDKKLLDVAQYFRMKTINPEDITART